VELESVGWDKPDLTRAVTAAEAAEAEAAVACPGDRATD